ncbi:unnamed protein product (mitochondrion) [Plasmodiophora brassicae]|uniref:V-type proton ATPase subunit H n=1 Tax=Plasmodiophora brassicae TaxID=37360 RepID=A0A0G4IW32_PLABS|nr:hypothetical protein PBRA_007243 [Plasmodiophora brassicae]SPQ95993.1 unnamed protein product [Plasmodiophora brassicae]
MLAHRDSLSGFEFDAESNVVDADGATERRLDWTRINVGLTPSAVELIKSAGTSAKDVYKQDGPALVSAILQCIQNSADEDVVQYVLTIADEILQSNPEAANLFMKLATKDYNPVVLLIRMLSRSNYKSFTMGAICSVLSVIMNALPKNDTQYDKWILQLGAWVSSKATDVTDRYHTVALSSLKLFLRRHNTQILFADNGTLACLVNILRIESTRNTQLVYQAAFCLWMLSYNTDVLRLFLRDNVAVSLVEVLQSVSREKVTRVILATIRNLVGKLSFNELFLQLNFLSVVDSVTQRLSSTDPELLDDILVIRTALLKDVKIYTSMEVLEQELARGKLKWTQVHTEQFWKENALKCEANQFAIIKQLIELLDSSDSRTVAIACFDLGEFARLHPVGKKIVRTLGGQERLMKQMSHESKDVQQQALLCVQKLMVNNWSGIQKGGTQPA